MPATPALAADPSADRHLPEVVVAETSLSGCTFLTEEEADAVAVAVAPSTAGDGEVQPRAGTVDAAVRYGVDLGHAAEQARLTGASGEVHRIVLPRPHSGRAPLPWTGLPGQLVLVGVGQATTRDLRTAGAALARSVRGLGRVLCAVGGDAEPDGLRAFVEGFLLASYRPPRVVAPSSPGGAAAGTDGEGADDGDAGVDARRAPTAAGRGGGAVEQLVILIQGPRAVAESAIASAQHGARATWLARDLANTPSNVKDPAWLAEQAVRLADENGLDVEVLEPAALEAGGFGGILGVGAGSASPPRLVVVSYRPIVPASGRTVGGRHVVVVGKGITYDTGGLSLKPRESMVPMKTDMAGAGAALAAVIAAARAGLRHRVTAVLPLAENHVGEASYRPGDVLTLHGGTTVEIANTDAEGRLVLADALAFADATLDPDLLIDLATLTGAATLGLGRGHAALYGEDDELTAALEAAAEVSGERVWRMPLVEDYEGALRSEVADLRHVPLETTWGAGSITAALFLRRFAGSRRWAHLDIAGPARATADRHEISAGATGYGARLLLRLLEGLD